MKERPIIFSGPMVRAILEGRKTQTRRIVRISAPARAAGVKPENAPIPFKVGQKLWVKETFLLRNQGNTVDYRADLDPCEAAGRGGLYGGWKPSLFMPRNLSRITLEITKVGVERLHQIGRDGRRAEHVLSEGILPEAIYREKQWFHPDDSPAIAFSRLWDSINGKKHPWKSNPWVWVIEFRKT